MKALVLLVILAASAVAQLPEFYKQVDRIVFVVPDAARSVAEWKASGVAEIAEVQSAALSAEYLGRKTNSSVRIGAGRFGDVSANWVQPVSGSNAFADFLRHHKAGVFALMHRVGSIAELEEEVKRMARLNVKVLQQGSMTADNTRYVFFDTQREGKYTLGIYFQPVTTPPPVASAPKVTQFAFIVRDEAPVSSYWARLGWPEMSVTHPQLQELQYRGKKADFQGRFGWMRHGKVPYEWIVPEKGPSTWHDHLEAHGEGVHHLAFDVSDIDRALAQWMQAGHEYVMGGSWGERGKRGYGRFAYLDAQRAGGIDVELLWNQR